MKLTLRRLRVVKNATIGELLVDGVFECYTLEDIVRPVKVMHETAIPAGTYKVILNMSPRFGKIMPRLLNVPGFDGILIHSGNTKDDTSGCILVGDKIEGDRIAGGTSRPAYARLFAKLQAAKGGIEIEIRDVEGR